LKILTFDDGAATSGRSLAAHAARIVRPVGRVYGFKKRQSDGRKPMCHLFAHQPQRDYESQTRSLRIGGHSTSIRLEMAFWDTLEEIAATQNMSLAKFVTTLHDEVLDHHGEVKNFASLLRCSCLIYRARSMQAVAEFHQAATPILDAAE
jgi:predicted DNA-binding ribbon-helix-helix protein